MLYIRILALINYDISDPQKPSSSRSYDLEGKSKIKDHYNTAAIYNSGTVLISQVLSHVFRRPYLSILPETSFMELGTYLATGYQVYVDGLIVAVDKRLVGRLSGKHILDRVLHLQYDEWSSVTAAELMDKSTSSVEMDSYLIQLLELFGETRFALAPITKRGVLIGSIGIRDLLPLISELNLDTSVTTAGSPIISCSRDETLKNAIELMLKKNIRNLVVSANGDDFHHYLVNDRKILEFIFSYEGKKVMEQGDGGRALSSVNIDHLDMIPVVSTSERTTISEAANMLRNINTPVLLFKNNIVTPWDVVMKPTGKEGSVHV